MNKQELTFAILDLFPLEPKRCRNKTLIDKANKISDICANHYHEQVREAVDIPTSYWGDLDMIYRSEALKAIDEVFINEAK